jgi:hypothetical protein
MRRAVLGISRRRYGYVNNNASRFSTGQYFWQHHVLRKRVLALVDLPIAHFKRMVRSNSNISHPAASSAVIEQLSSTLPVLLHKYQMFATLRDALFTTGAITSITNFTTLPPQLQPSPLSVNPVNKLLVFTPLIESHAILPVFNRAVAFGITAASPELLLRKTRARHKLNLLQQRLARCS